VFDKIELPEKFDRKYIEWIVPDKDETLQLYVRRMAESIDTSQPFILVGYSFGGMVIQEMNAFLKPVKNILIASIKNESEIPPILRLGKRMKFAERFPFWDAIETQQAKEFFAKIIYQTYSIQVSQFIIYNNPYYIRWSVQQILNWKPSTPCNNLYHIHGTRDITFPHKYIKDAYLIDGANHFLVLADCERVSAELAQILAL
jgi:hypothetical protein